MADPGMDIAQGVPAGIAGMGPVGSVLGQAAGGGQQLIQMLMQLLQGGQTPPFNPGGGSQMPTIPPTGTPPFNPQGGLKGRMTGGK